MGKIRMMLRINIESTKLNTPMKKMIVLIVAGMLFSFATYAQDCKPQKKEAVVEQVLGMYVFVDSTPKAEYNYLGNVTAGSGLGKAMGGAAEYEAKKMRLIKKAKEEFPNADGVILHFVQGGKDYADAIKFKE